ncbi:MAPEG family protein [Sphingomonas sp. PB4P5]|uniref:MAPEG family protein n=1 Tax=Parasphingomonas puruogangriensis TaxID=3096155 RepID=UPI002FC89CDE
MQTITLPITLATTGGAAIIALWLGLRAGQTRAKAKVDIGDGGDAMLIARMRAQANYVEYAPFIVALIAVLEFTTGSSTWLWIAAILFLVARVLHPLGMDGLKGARMIGILITFLLLLALGGYAIALPLIDHYGAPRGAVEAVPAAG